MTLEVRLYIIIIIARHNVYAPSPTRFRAVYIYRNFAKGGGPIWGMKKRKGAEAHIFKINFKNTVKSCALKQSGVSYPEWFKVLELL